MTISSVVRSSSSSFGLSISYYNFNCSLLTYDRINADKGASIAFYLNHNIRNFILKTIKIHKVIINIRDYKIQNQ